MIFPQIPVFASDTHWRLLVKPEIQGKDWLTATVARIAHDL
jgi:hypothetical protein